MALQVRRQKDSTAAQEGYVRVLWFTRCCARHEKAEKVDKWIKYVSSVALSLTLSVLCFCMLAHGVRLSFPFNSRVSGTGPVKQECQNASLLFLPLRRYRYVTLACYCLQFRVGAMVLALVAGADFSVGSYCLVLDEFVKDWRLVRTKPYEMELDDALALTDDDALARDMFARNSKNDGKSYYMEVTHPFNCYRY